jgi:hypothetical protein
MEIRPVCPLCMQSACSALSFSSIQVQVPEAPSDTLIALPPLQRLAGLPRASNMSVDVHSNPDLWR